MKATFLKWNFLQLRCISTSHSIQCYNPHSYSENFMYIFIFIILKTGNALRSMGDGLAPSQMGGFNS